MILYVFLSCIFWIINFFWRLPTLFDTDRVHYFILFHGFLVGEVSCLLMGSREAEATSPCPCYKVVTALPGAPYKSHPQELLEISPSILFYLLPWILEWIINVTSITKEYVPCLMSPWCTSSCPFPFLFTARLMNGWVFCLNLLLCLELPRSNRIAPQIMDPTLIVLARDSLIAGALDLSGTYFLIPGPPL